MYSKPVIISILIEEVNLGRPMKMVILEGPGIWFLIRTKCSSNEDQHRTNINSMRLSELSGDERDSIPKTRVLAPDYFDD